MTTDDLSELTPAEQCAFHAIRKRVAEFTVRQFKAAERRGELPTGRERLRRIFDAGWAEDFKPREAKR